MRRLVKLESYSNEKTHPQHRGGTDSRPVRREDGDNARIPRYPDRFHGTMRSQDFSRESCADLPIQNKNQIERTTMTTLINKSKVKRYILDYAATNRSHKFTRVSQEAIDRVEAAARAAAKSIVTSAPSKGKTLL